MRQGCGDMGDTDEINKMHLDDVLRCGSGWRHKVCQLRRQVKGKTHQKTVLLSTSYASG